jgi:death-on-curing family protein
MSGQDYDEEQKIDIANAIDNGELGINGEDHNKMD